MSDADLAKYIKQVSLPKQGKKECKACGSDVRSPNKDGICHFCELPCTMAAKNVDKSASKSIETVWQLIGDSKWDAAATYFPSIAGQKDDPVSVYCAGIFYRYYSDRQYHDQDHNLLGYMEQNAKNMHDSLYTIVTAKDYLFRAIKLVSLDQDAQRDEKLLYLDFITNVRLKRLHLAAKTLQLLNALQKTSIATEYANMVYAVETSDKSAEEKLSMMLNKQEPNAYYYLALHLVQKKRLRDALTVLDALSKSVHMPMAEELSRKVRITMQASAL